MLKKNNVLQITLIILSLVILFKIFQFDSKTKEIKNQLVNANKKISESLKLAKDTEEEIDLLLLKVKNDYEKEMQELKNQKNSIIAKQKNNKQRQGEELKVIEKKIKNIHSDHNDILKEIEDDE